MSTERDRISAASARSSHWRRWGPYLSERSWGTVREDYSPNGTAWDYFPFSQSGHRAYRWTEDGLLGICDNHQRLCFSLALWNGSDPILKERPFGLAGPEGNHSEDVKELYYYLDSTPTHSYMKGLYKYPQNPFPYDLLREENNRRNRLDREFEIMDTGIFEDNRYFDVFMEYAKADVDDILIRYTIINRGPDKASLVALPTTWFRNSWSWGRSQEVAPVMRRMGDNWLLAEERSLGPTKVVFEGTNRVLFTENNSNSEKLWGFRSSHGYYKDAFQEFVLHSRFDAVNSGGFGTKACGVYAIDLEPGEQHVIQCRICPDGTPDVDFDAVFKTRIEEADAFYQSFLPEKLSADAARVERQAFAGLLWSKQYFHYIVEDWLNGDPSSPPPDEGRKKGRNSSWVHLYNDDIISMPDKWEYPWYAAWDLAFHMIPMALVDPDFAKSQLKLFLREWYMHPNGQIPAYEWAFGDVNPPVHAWACWRVYQIDRKITGKPDFDFLEKVFHKLMLNFTWWVNRKDSGENNIFEGGFLGLDNIGVFDRSKPLPTGGYLEQSDGTSWMAMFSLNMLKIALELAKEKPVYEDVASKFFEHFLYIATAVHGQGDDSLWDPAEGFYYDRVRLPDGRSFSMKVRSMVGLIPLFAVDTIEPSLIEALPGFRRRMEWFVKNRPDLCRNLASMTRQGQGERRLLSIVGPERLRRILTRMLDETEFLSPHGIRSLSRIHKDQPYSVDVNGETHSVDYEPAESKTGLFGGNSNWRGPIWFPVNYLLIESLQRFHHYLGNDFKVEYPTGSGQFRTLSDITVDLSRRLSGLFLRNPEGRRPMLGNNDKMQRDEHFADHILFHEYFHGDTGEGLGASHQTGWTALVAKLIQQSGV